MRRLVIAYTPWPETTYDTIDEAIAGAPEVQSRRARSEADSKVIRDSIIESFRWSDSRVELGFSSGQVLAIFMREGAVTWVLQSNYSIPEASPADQAPIEMVYECWDGTNLIAQWDRSLLASRRLGRKLQMIFASEALLWVYVEGESILMFIASKVRGAGNLLSWSDSQ